MPRMKTGGTGKKKRKVRQSPRISVNELAKYLSAEKPAERRDIVKQQKFPPDYMAAYYRDAIPTICKFIQGGMEDEEIIVSKIDRLHATTPRNRPDETRLPYNAKVLETFLESYSLLDISDVCLQPGSNSGPKDTYSGVPVSVRPEFLLTTKYRGEDVVGALKLFVSMTVVLSDDTGATISTVVWNHMKRNFGGLGRPLQRMSYTWDVCGKKVHQATRATKKRLAGVAAACEEVALYWDHFTEE